MNAMEHRMLDILSGMKASGLLLGVKAEFEAEGTRIDELLRLVDLAKRADTKIALKIGGCEAVRDMLESKQIGVDYIVAPMIETAYALSKFIAAIHKVFEGDEREDVGFFLNLETITGFENVESILDTAAKSQIIKGVVFGRVDFVGSMGLPRDSVNSSEVLEKILKVSDIAKKRNLDVVVGGAISVEAIPFLREIKSLHLTKFETRKIIFDGNAVNSSEIEAALLQAVEFELLWLKNKQKYYSLMSKEDDARIKMLDDRWKIFR